jgi:hypothetical protein
VPEGSRALIDNPAEGAITIESEADVVCVGLAESLTETVKLNVPFVVGVPEIDPVPEPRLSPAGRPETIDHL